VLGYVATARTLQQIGSYLRALHTLTARLSGRAGVRLSGHACADGAAAELVAGALRDVARVAQRHGRLRLLFAAEADALRTLLDQYWEHIKQPVAARFLHTDVSAQNILVDTAGKVTWLVDFDRALWGTRGSSLLC
jgi:Ser/Thr protein kinase RdoA (MazF antagonist)